MKRGNERGNLRRFSVLGAMALGAFTLCAMTESRESVAYPGLEELEPVVRVEEDWVMALNEPDDDSDSPQFHTVMSPYGHLDSFFAQVLWNYRETPDFAAGGLQLQSWDGESLLRRRGVRVTPLSTQAETITWTQSLETDGVMLSFDIANGNSTTWGAFDRDMRIDSDASLMDLHGYSTDISVEDSCITFGSNRVDYLLISQVRYYGASGALLSVDATPRFVFVLEPVPSE